MWDLSSYDGIQVDVVKGDGKRYTLIVKDTVPEDKRGTGREKASVNWEYDFEAGEDKSEIWVPWSSFKAVYRGVEKPDAAPLRTEDVKRFTLMFRRYAISLKYTLGKHAELLKASSRNKRETSNSSSHPCPP